MSGLRASRGADGTVKVSKVNTPVTPSKRKQLEQSQTQTQTQTSDGAESPLSRSSSDNATHTHTHHHHHHHHKNTSGGTPKGKGKQQRSKQKRRRNVPEPEVLDEVELTPEMLQQLLGGVSLGDGMEFREGSSYPSVLKVFTTIQEPDYHQPWSTQGVQQATGSGVVIGENLVLTAAHVIANNTFVQLQRGDDPNKCVATVHAVAHECDLALLRADNAEYLADIEPVEIGDLPLHRDKVMVVGFPLGGTELSVTEGVVSRIEGQAYSHSQRELLAVTVDAPINSGNSGGPVFNDDGVLIGIAFQALVSAENVGHIVPPPVINHFLEGIEKDGPTGYQGFPTLGIEGQHLVNPHLRAHVGLTGKQCGILVTDVIYGNSCHEKVKKYDVILSIDGVDVANNGSVSYMNGLRVDFQILVSLKPCHEKCTLRVWRDKQEIDVEITLLPPLDLIPLAQYDSQPPFVIFLGLVFQPLSLDFLAGQFAHLGGAPKEFLYLFETGNPSETRNEVVVLAQVLSDSVNDGYDELTQMVVKTVNGKEIGSLRELATLFETFEGETLVVKSPHEDLLILPGPKTDIAKEAHQRILARYRVPRDRSDDLSVHTLLRQSNAAHPPAAKKSSSDSLSATV